MKNRKIGAVREGRIPIYDGEGRMRGNVGKTATAVTVSRFINQHGATLGKVKGRTAWIGPASPEKPTSRKPETANHKSARGSVRAPNNGERS